MYAGVLNELEEANNILEGYQEDMSGDIIYRCKAHNAKTVKSFPPPLLIHLSKKENKTTLNKHNSRASPVSRQKTRYSGSDDVYGVMWVL